MVGVAVFEPATPSSRTRRATIENPINAPNTSSTLKEVEPAARALGLQIQIFQASTGLEIDTAFAALVPTRPDVE